MERDERFKGMATDPRFRSLPTKQRKVKIDSRFKAMFTDKKFKIKSTVDQRGRPLRLTSNEHLKKFYELSSEDECSSDEDEEINQATKAKHKSVEQKKSEKDRKMSKKSVDTETAVKPIEDGDSHTDSDDEEGTEEDGEETQNVEDIEGDGEEEEEDDEEEEDEDRGIKPTEDYARGIVMESSSSDETETEEDEEVIPFDQEAHDDHYWGEQDADAEEIEKATRRLAIMNMDWDRINAYDIYLLLSSFKPSSGILHSVKIYPSEFGKQKMKEDDVSGPKELQDAKLNSKGKGAGALKKLNEKEQVKAMMESLRQYQLNRLRYYYAIATFDSPETADHVYTHCDKREYLASSIQLDLRFVPDDMDFDDDEVKEVANHVPDNYQPRIFINAARGQSLVRCTWDETAPDRYDRLNKKYSQEEIESLDLQAYLASDSSSEDGGDNSADLQNDDKPVGSLRNKKLKKKKNRKAADPGRSEELEQVIGDADDSDDEDEDDEEKIRKYRELLLGDSKKNPDDDIDMEITWETGLKDTTEDVLAESMKKRQDKSLSVFERNKQKKKDTRKLANSSETTLQESDKTAKCTTKKKTKKNRHNNTDPIDSIVAFSDDELPEDMFADQLTGDEVQGSKKKSRNKKHQNVQPNSDDEISKKDLDLMLLDDQNESTNKKHFNIKEIIEYDNMTKSKKKRKMKRNELKEIEDDFEINVADDRFSALYSSHLYNIDPSSQDYRKTKSMEAIVNEKQRRILNQERIVDQPNRSKERLNSSGSKISTSVKDKARIDLKNLVKSVKTKSQQFNSQQPKRRKVQ